MPGKFVGFGRLLRAGHDDAIGIHDRDVHKVHGEQMSAADRYLNRLSFQL
jgi:hypothetical protein